jgi:BCD family chlorophyll transporter-like MFS transporter
MTHQIGWAGVARLGLVQACMGAVVVLTTSTLNRVMVVELALAAVLPGLMVALHFLVQISRPRMGHGSDVGGRRTPWIIGGMVLLAAGGMTATLGTVWAGSHTVAGLAVALLGFLLIGTGVSACGTNLLVMLAKSVPAQRRGPAATLVWIMMIAGFAITAGLAGRWLDPYSPERLLQVAACICALAVAITTLAVLGLERSPRQEQGQAAASIPAATPVAFGQALQQVWAEPAARRFTIFVFVSMLAYSAQDLILEPFAGSVFGYTPGSSTQLSGVQHGGVLLGMLMVAGAGLLSARRPQLAWARAIGSLRGWTVGGCLASGVAMAGLALAGLVGSDWPLKTNVFLLGVANGAFSIGAIGSMMRMAGEGRSSREGVRMGLWGAAQALAFGIGGLLGTVASDIAHWLLAAEGSAYASVFALESCMFFVSAALAWKIRLVTQQVAADPASPRTPEPRAAALQVAHET